MYLCHPEQSEGSRFFASAQNDYSALVVQWIERLTPNETMAVRFSPRAHDLTNGFIFVRFKER
jgi:hypothetical protein